MVDGACQARSSQWCPLTHAFLGIDSERDHCKMRVFVLTRRTREGPSNRPLFFFLLVSQAQPLRPARSPIAHFFFFFFQIVSSNPRCANRRWQTMLLTFSSPAVSLLPILYRLFLFVVSIYDNSNKKHREASFSFTRFWSVLSISFHSPSPVLRNN